VTNAQLLPFAPKIDHGSLEIRRSSGAKLRRGYLCRRAKLIHAKFKPSR
jgi:hypothetical protein